jgi:chorismate synthase
MAGNIFGRIFRVTTFGESHGSAMGCVVDGCPAGLGLSPEDIRKELERRKANCEGNADILKKAASTSRNEDDLPEILSGVFEGRTLGTPIAILIRNTNQRTEDYAALRDVYRPGHADWTWEAKYGFRDHRGGGRISGRETVSRVAAGAVAKKFLSQSGIVISSKIEFVAGLPADSGELPVRIEELSARGDSCGGIVSCSVIGLPPGLGEPVFDKLNARLSSAVLSIGGCKGIEFGEGFNAARLLGSENNDEPVLGLKQPPAEGVPSLDFLTNRAGGVYGGISSGKDVVFKAAFKAPSSIGQAQKTIDRNGEVKETNIKGRHDICFVPRILPVVEAMTALTLADFLLLQRAARLTLSDIKRD